MKYVQKKGKFYVPTREMKKIAWINSKKIYSEARKNPLKFWAKFADELAWFKKWKRIYEEKLPHYKWFIGGKINISYNCVDRWVKERGNKVAIFWEPEPMEERERVLTYRDLYREVNLFANTLKRLGVKKGDRVVIYMPMIPEVIIAMLACTRIGAIHSVVFSAFSSDALRTRILDSDAKVLVTADGYYRRGKLINLKEQADEGKKGTSIRKTIVVRRADNNVRMGPNEYWWHELREKVDDYCEPTKMNAEDIAFILYTSGTTGKPKGVMHATGGYLVQAYTTAKIVFDLHPWDVFFSTADIGWITGHTYSCYGPLSNGATFVIYEGAPDYPTAERIWQIIEKYGVTIFYTAPTLVRAMMRYGDEHVEKYKMKTLRLLASVGEPIDEKAWKWFFEKIGKKRCPIIDTWWQTETGGTLINTLPGIGPFIPSVAGLPFPGSRFDVFDERGRLCRPGEEGELVGLGPFTPGMLRGVWRNEKRYLKTYWSQYPNAYYVSDRAYKTKEGFIRIVGRSDDVIKVAGHRLSTAEMEDAISHHKAVAECAVVGMPDEIKGQVPVAFVVLKRGARIDKKDIIKQIDTKIGKFARPRYVVFVNDLPHTRSGKIMRRILKRLITGEELGDISTLANPDSVNHVRKRLKDEGVI